MWRRPVRCIDTGVVYPSTSEAAKANKLHHANISRCCNGRLYKVGGHRWEYVSDCVPVGLLYTVYDNRTDFPIIVAGTAREAAKAMGIKISSFHSTVTRVRQGKIKRWWIETIIQGDEE